jgi:hypothetical protein
LTLKKYIIQFILLFWASQIFASAQVPDYIIYRKDTIETYNLLVEQYLQNYDTTKTNKLFGLSFRSGSSTNCWRGYQAIYKIENDSLFLIYIINCGELRNGKIDKAKSIEKITQIFGDKLINERVYINWFDGLINFPLTNKMLRWDGVFYRIFEKEKVIAISNGHVGKIVDVENYVDDRKRIDRRYGAKTSDILFKKLKKSNWKNAKDFDCSETYMVTIDENGSVSKVRMLRTQEEIEKYYEKEEYNFCIDKMFNALKSLRFDIIKDKGKPIAEEIYIKILQEDNGKIEQGRE